MKDNNKDNGWFNTYNIANSEYISCGYMRCHKCKKKIEGDFLIKDRKNFLHRGNETDERYLYHRECSSHKGAWKKFDRLMREKEEEYKLMEERDKKVKELIEKYGIDEDDLNL